MNKTNNIKIYYIYIYIDAYVINDANIFMFAENFEFLFFFFLLVVVFKGTYFNIYLLN